MFWTILWSWRLRKLIWKRLLKFCYGTWYNSKSSSFPRVSHPSGFSRISRSVLAHLSWNKFNLAWHRVLVFRFSTSLCQMKRWRQWTHSTKVPSIARFSSTSFLGEFIVSDPSVYTSFSTFPFTDCQIIRNFHLKSLSKRTTLQPGRWIY